MYQAHTDRIARNLLGLDGEVPWLTLRQAIREANELLETTEGCDLTHLGTHRDYLQRRLAEAMRLTGDVSLWVGRPELALAH